MVQYEAAIDVTSDSIERSSIAAFPIGCPGEAMDWDRVGALLEGALALPADVRAGFLHGTCGRDAEMRADVMSHVRYVTSFTEEDRGGDSPRPCRP